MKKYDPLWEYAGIKHPLMGAEPDVDAKCPRCHVRLHLGTAAAPGQQVECGLCGEPLEIVQEGGALAVRSIAGAEI